MRLWRRRPPQRPRVTLSHPSWSHCVISVAEFQLGRILSPLDSKWYSGWSFLCVNKSKGGCIDTSNLALHTSLSVLSHLPKHVLDDKEVNLHFKFDFWSLEKPPTLLAYLGLCGMWWKSSCIVQMHWLPTTSCGGVKFNASTVCQAAIWTSAGTHGAWRYTSH